MSYPVPVSRAESDLIARIRSRVFTRDDVVLGIGDDAALLQPPIGRQLVVAMDALNVGVHFPHNTRAADIGWKALAVNLSDLAAMGAEPAWCTLALSLPEADEAWLDGFLDGFLPLAQQHRVALVGGDTTRGPLSVCVAVHGFVEPGQALRRDAARIGDDIWVSGQLGDAAAALALLLDEEGNLRQGHDALRQRLNRPTPRVELGRALVGLAHAGIDLSDGLLADLDHVCQASGVGMQLQLDALPASTALSTAMQAEPRLVLQVSGGDDYELAFSAASTERARLLALSNEIGVPLSRIGQVLKGERVRVLDSQGQEWLPPRSGYQHFSE